VKRYAILLVALFLVFAGCDDGNEVGGGVKVPTGEEGTGEGAIRDTTTTSPPTTQAPVTTQAPTQTTSKPVATTSPPTTQAPQSIALTIGIWGDSSGKNQFEPRQGAVRNGQTVRFQNNDNATRGVEDSNGAWRSPDIPAGGFWDYKATASGTYNYNDTTRPYAVGQLVVR